MQKETPETRDQLVLNAVLTYPNSPPSALCRNLLTLTRAEVLESLERLALHGKVSANLYGGSLRYLPKGSGITVTDRRNAIARGLAKQAVARQRPRITPSRTLTNATPGLGDLSLAGFMASSRPGSTDFLKAQTKGVR